MENDFLCSDVKVWCDESDDASYIGFLANKNHKKYGFLCVGYKKFSFVSFNSINDWAELKGFPTDVYVILWDKYLSQIKVGGSCDCLGVKYVRVW